MKTGKKSLLNRFISDFGAGFTTGFNQSKAAAAKKHLIKRQNFQKAFKTSFCQTSTSVYYSKVVRPAVIGVLSFMVGILAGNLLSPVVDTTALEQQPEQTEEQTTVMGEQKALLVKSEMSSIAEETNYQLAKATPISYLPNTTYTGYSLQIPSIGLYTNVSTTYVDSGNNIVVPNYGVGVLTQYAGRTFNLLVGHRTGIFAGLGGVRNGDAITYYGNNYVVTSISQLPNGQIRMYDLTRTSTNTIVLMTCAGPNNSERLIIKATLR